MALKYPAASLRGRVGDTAHPREPPPTDMGCTFEGSLSSPSSSSPPLESLPWPRLGCCTPGGVRGLCSLRGNPGGVHLGVPHQGHPRAPLWGHLNAPQCVGAGVLMRTSSRIECPSPALFNPALAPLASRWVL